jgi:hypothetical protein
MDFEKFEIQAIDYLSGNLETSEQNDFEEFLNNHPAYQNIFDGLKDTWQDIDAINIPTPSGKMDERFYDMLSEKAEMATNANHKQLSSFRIIIERMLKPQLAYATLILCTGLVLGYFLRPSSNPEPIKSSVVKVSEPYTEGVRQQLVLTLLEQPSANQRLKGINEANKIQKTDQTVISALFKTLNNDTNVNVRLAAIESLTNYIDNPMVRQGLVQSIVKQDSPIVQVTLANLMMALQEKESIEPFKTLMQNKDLNTSVKEKLEITIKSII